MTGKIYRSAMGKEVDLGALLLQNEHVRAVGNMNVNARGDLLDGANRVIETKSKQVQRQIRKTTAMNQATVHESNVAAKRAKIQEDVEEENVVEEDPDLSALDPTPVPVSEPDPVVENTSEPTTFGPTGEGGLAAAIARSRLIKQEKEKTLREKQQSQGLRKI